MSATYNSNENWEIFEEIIENRGMTGIEVLEALTNWHGMQLLDYDCTENFIEEYGY